MSGYLGRGFWHGKLFLLSCPCNTQVRGPTTLVGSPIFLLFLYTLLHQYTYLSWHVHPVAYHLHPIHIALFFLSYITSLVHLFISTCIPCGIPFTSYTHPLTFSLGFYAILQFTCFHLSLSLSHSVIFPYCFTSLFTFFFTPFSFFFFYFSPSPPMLCRTPLNILYQLYNLTFRTFLF